MKKLIFLILTMIFFMNAKAQQQRPVQSLYMFDQLLINPAYAGTQVQFSATSTYRNQWVNLEGAPETFTFTTQSSFYRGQAGVGLIFFRDVLGVHSSDGVFMAGSYALPMPTGKLYFGLQGGFTNIQSDFTRTNVPSVGGQANGGVDGALDRFYTSTSAFNWNFGTGLFYTNEDFYMGISVPYLVNNDVIQDFSDGGSIGDEFTDQIKNTRTYYVSAGKTFPLSPNFKFIGSTLLRFQEGSPFTFDANVNGVFKETIGLGVSYRLTEGFVYLFELKLNENFHVGYAYDMTVSTLGQVSAGSHEFLLNYRIKIPRLHKGLPCPSYF